jgi:hypothetical protein
MSNKDTRHGHEEEIDSPQEIEDENERERQETRSKNRMPTLGLNFTEAAGKVVAFVNVINDPPNWQALEVRFTDGTLLHFEVLTTRVQIKTKYMEARRGDLKLIRNYGVLLTEREKKSR